MLKWTKSDLLSHKGVTRIFMQPHLAHAVARTKLFAFGHDVGEFYKNEETFCRVSQFDGVAIRTMSNGGTSSCALVTGTSYS